MKIYLIGLYSYKENYGDVQYIVKATTSYESARQIAKVILRGGEQGNNHIIELFEEWKNHEKD